MIAKAVKGKGFRGALEYDLTKEKGQLLDTNMAGKNPRQLAAEFGKIRKLKPNLGKAVLHVSLSAALGEKLTDAQWREIGQHYLKGMGLDNNQYVMTRHSDTEHEHIHIVANRIQFDGKVSSDSQDYKRQDVLMRQIEKQFGLAEIAPAFGLDGKKVSGRKAPSKGEIEAGLRTDQPSIRLQLQQLCDTAAKDCDSVTQYRDRLAAVGVEILPAFQLAGEKLNGLTYKLDGVVMKGGDLGKAYSPVGLSKKGVTYDKNRDFESLSRGAEQRQAEISRRVDEIGQAVRNVAGANFRGFVEAANANRQTDARLDDALRVAESDRERVEAVGVADNNVGAPDRHVHLNAEAGTTAGTDIGRALKGAQQRISDRHSGAVVKALGQQLRQLVPAVAAGASVAVKNHLTTQAKAQAEQQQALDAKTRALRDSLVAPLEKNHATARADLQDASRKASAELNDERRALHQVNPPTQAQGGHQEALATLRQRDEVVRAALAAMISGPLRLGDDEEEKKRRRARELSGFSILKALTRVVASNGVITYSLHGRAVVRDEGQHLAVLDPNSDEVIEAALLLAYKKFGTNLSLTGPPEFQRRTVAVAVNRGIPIKFIDPQLEAIRLELTERKQQERIPVVQNIQPKPAKREGSAPEATPQSGQTGLLLQRNDNVMPATGVFGATAFDPVNAQFVAQQAREAAAKLEVNAAAKARGITAVPYPDGGGSWAAEHHSSYETAQSKAAREVQFRQQREPRPADKKAGAAWDARTAELEKDVQRWATEIKWRDAAFKAASAARQPEDAAHIAAAKAAHDREQLALPRSKPGLARPGILPEPSGGPDPRQLGKSGKSGPGR